jgi:hypothetical protein
MRTHTLLTAARRAAASHISPPRKPDAALRVVLEDLHAMLFPEQHPGYDPDHVYWQDHDVNDPSDRDPFQWSSETIEWVATWLEHCLAGLEG